MATQNPDIATGIIQEKEGAAMPVIFKMKVVKIGNSMRLTIPKPVVDGLALQEGDVLIITVENNEMVIKKEGQQP